MISRRPVYGTTTPVSGTASFTLHVRKGHIKQIYLEATTSTTTFDFKLVDSEDDEVYLTEDETGVLNERLSLPTFTALTATISNASVDEAFTYHFALEE